MSVKPEFATLEPLNSVSSRVIREKINDHSRISIFSISETTSEFYISLSIKKIKQRSFHYHLEIAIFEYLEILQKFNLDCESLIMLHVFIDDLEAKVDIAKEAFSSIVKNKHMDTPLTIIQQPPLSDSAISFLAYHVKSHFPLRKERLCSNLDKGIVCDSYMVSFKNYKYIWTLNMRDRQKASRNNAFLQSKTLFETVSKIVSKNGGALRDNLMRTWIYVDDIDNNYKNMNKGRAAVFAKKGLIPKTHFVTSTGIGGKMCYLNETVVSMNTLSILGIKEGQVSYIRPYNSMNDPHEYNIAFERGTKLEYGDRTHVYVSGTASIDKHGRVAYHKDIIKQTRRTFSNIEAVLRYAGVAMVDLAFLIMYVRNPYDDSKVKEITDDILPNIPYALVHGPVCRPAWLVEIEGLAIRKSTKTNFNNF